MTSFSPSNTSIEITGHSSNTVTHHSTTASISQTYQANSNMPAFPRHSKAVYAAERKAKTISQSPPIQYTNQSTASKSSSLDMNTSQGLPGFPRQSEALLEAERQAKPIAQSPPIHYTHHKQQKDFDVESMASSISREKEEALEAFSQSQSMKARLSKILHR